MSEMVEAMRQVLAGKIYLCQALAEKLLRRIAGEGGAALAQSPLETLSDRELEVLRLIG